MNRVDRLLRTDTVHGVQKFCTDQILVVCMKYLQVLKWLRVEAERLQVGPSFGHEQLLQSRSTRFSEWSRRTPANRCDPSALKDAISHLK